MHLRFTLNMEDHCVLLCFKELGTFFPDKAEAFDECFSALSSKFHFLPREKTAVSDPIPEDLFKKCIEHMIDVAPELGQSCENLLRSLLDQAEAQKDSKSGTYL